METRHLRPSEGLVTPRRRDRIDLAKVCLGGMREAHTNANVDQIKQRRDWPGHWL